MAIITNTDLLEDAFLPQQRRNNTNLGAPAPAPVGAGVGQRDGSLEQAQIGGNDELDDAIIVEGIRPNDHRVRISAFAGQDDEIYGSLDRTNLLYPLRATGGLMFPYTPTISISQDTTYNSADLEQTNYDILSFQKSSSASLSVVGNFTFQNQREGEYMMAAIHFLRSSTKSYFGKRDADRFQDLANQQEDQGIAKVREDGKAGLPPPVLLFSGYGDMMFNNIRVVIRGYSFNLDDSVDMVPITLPNGSEARLPPLLSLSVSLGIQANPNELREEFSLAEFRTGRLLSTRRGWF